MPKAYSYTRFSTPEQALGDSQRRQVEAARKFADEHGLELDESSFVDLGVSAFHGQNVNEGGLGQFLDAVKAGVVPSGSYLLVENLDRLSRQTARKALRVLEDIVEAGIIVVTLADRRIYNEENLNDPLGLMISLFSFIRAHEESETKSNRLKEAWHEKRNKIQDEKLTSRCPAWLELNSDRTAFNVLENRAEVVRRIFNDYLDGLGPDSIATALNRDGIEPWGWGKATAKMWYRSYVVKILDSPSVTGVYVPHKMERSTEGKKRRVPLEPVPGYFPEIVDPLTFRRVQDMRTTKSGSMRGRKASFPLRNVLSRVAVCAECGSTLVRMYKGELPKGGEYLVCSRRKVGGCDGGPRHRYDVLVDVVLSSLRKCLFEIPTQSDNYKGIGDAIYHLEWDLKDVKLQQENLMRALKRGKVTLESPSESEEPEELISWLDLTLPKTVREELQNLDRLSDSLTKKIKELEGERSGLSMSALDHKIGALKSVLFSWDPPPVEELNARLREVLASVAVGGSGGPLGFQFRHLDDPVMVPWESS